MNSDQRLTVDLYVRADEPIVERRSDVIERLERLEDRDRIRDFRVRPWPRAISLDLVRNVEGEGVHDAVRSFEAWADRHDRRLHPPFDVRTSRSAITGETEELLVLPVLCVAAYADETLVGVAPSSDGETTCTVGDALDDLAAGRAPVPDVSVEGRSASSDGEGPEPTRITE